MPLVEKNGVLLAKTEGTAGTAESLSTSDGVWNILNPQFFERAIPSTKRQLQGSFNKNPSIPGARGGVMKFTMGAVGHSSAASPAWATTLLAACGATESSRVWTFGKTCSPLTMAMYWDGVVEKIVGATGTFVMRYVAGQMTEIDFTFTGKLADDADAAVPAPTFPTVIPPRWAGNAITLGALTPKCSQFTFDLGNVIAYREDPADSTGYIATHITDRNCTATLDPEADLVATHDPLTLLKASTEVALSVALGSASNNTITLATSKAQIVEAPLGSRNGIVVRNLTLDLNVAPTITFS